MTILHMPTLFPHSKDPINSKLDYTSLSVCEFPDGMSGLHCLSLDAHSRSVHSQTGQPRCNTVFTTATMLRCPQRLDRTSATGPRAQQDISIYRGQEKSQSPPKESYMCVLTFDHSAVNPAVDHFRCMAPSIRYTPTDTVQAVISSPGTVTQYSSFQWQLEITNLHPTMPANNLSIQTEITEGFSWSGSRHVSVPMLLPFQQFTYNFSAIPMTPPGLHPLPRIRVLQSETEIPREVAIQTRNEVSSEGAVQVMVNPL
jgi:hypothetical protein